MDKQKVIIFTLDITIPGGIERVISNMAIYYQNSEKFDVEIVSLFKKNKDLCYFIPANTKIFFLSDQAYDLTSFWKKVKSHICILRVLSKYRPSCNSILLSTMTNITIYLVLLNFKYKKLIAAEHGYYYAFGRLTRMLRRFLYRFVDTVVTLTNSEKKTYDKFCKNVVAIPNALSFYPSTKADMDNKRVISVGRLVYEKGFENLLPIYITLANKYPDWEFTIWGSGYLENKIKKLLADAPVNVKLYPHSNDIQYELLKSSIYVCSSTTEAFPMVLLEAQACGLPIVSFDCPPGPREIINDQLDGILVTPNKFNLLAAEIELMINSTERRTFYSVNARKNAIRFLPEHVYTRWDLLFV